MKRLRRQGELPHEVIALTHTEANQVIVKRVSAKAYLTGVREGMPLSLAQALTPNLITEPFNPEQDCRALFGLAYWAHQFSPLVALDSELLETIKKGSLNNVNRRAQGIVINLTGTSRLHRSEEQLLIQLESSFKKNNYTARFAIADTLALAWGVSRFAQHASTIVEPKASSLEILAPLPIAALRIDFGAIEILKEVGITTIAQLTKIPRRKLASQIGFGPLKKLDQAQGALLEPIIYLREEKKYSVGRSFHSPLESKIAIQQTVATLFDKLALILSEQQLTATRFIVRLSAPRNRSLNQNQVQNILTKELSLSSGCTSAAQLSQVIDPFVESIHICSGIESISVSAPTPIPINTPQAVLPSFSLENSEICREELELLLNQCAARFGPESIRQVALSEDYSIEDSYSHSAYKQKPTHKLSTQPLAIRSDTPPKIFEIPQEIKVISLLPDFTPAHIQWKNQRLKITRTIGPERIAQKWHDQVAANSIDLRDYFKVEAQSGEWLWIFREHKNLRWFIHGLWI